MLSMISGKVPPPTKDDLKQWIKNAEFKSYGDFVKKAADAYKNGMDFSKPLERRILPEGKLLKKIYEVLWDEGGFVKWDFNNKRKMRRKSGISLMKTFEEKIEILNAQEWIKINEEGDELQVIIRHREGVVP